jgi:glycosidase
MHRVVSVGLSVSLAVFASCSDDVFEAAAIVDPVLEDLQAEETQRSLSLRALPDTDTWTERVLYFALLDRFIDGDASNLRSHGASECNRPGDPHAYQGGDLAGLLNDGLGYLEDLGVDALWISPLYRGVPDKQGANCGFPGYWAEMSDPYELAIDPRFGDAALVDDVLDSAHARGMKVMLDMVVNHAGYDATLVRQHPDWFNDETTCWKRGQPDIDCPLAGLPDFNHDNQEAADYLVDLHLQWANRFSFDGVRMDTVKHVTPAYFSRWTSAMREARPDLYMIGELLDEHDFSRYDRYLQAGFDGLFNFPLRQGLIASFGRGESVDAAAGRMQETLQRFGATQTAQMVNLLDNHDVRRFTEEIPSWVSPDDARRRYLMAMTALLTLPGIPQIYAGNEVGMYGGTDPDNRRFLPQWVLNEDSRQHGSRHGFLEHPNVVFDVTQRLIQLRHRLPALKRGSYRELWRQNGSHNNNVWAYLRESDGNAVIVAYNNGTLATNGRVPLNVSGAFSSGEALVDVLGLAGINNVVVEGNTLWLSLPAQSAVLLVRANAPHPLEAHVDVRFSVEATTAWGQNVYVIGESLELGGWDLGRSIRLSPTACNGARCTWVGSVALPRGSELDFKFVKIDERLRTVWEAGFNRTLVPADGSSVTATFR